MILNEEPYLNEPGWATQQGTPQSKACECPILRHPTSDGFIGFADSANVRRMVVHTAVSGSFSCPQYPNNLRFADARHASRSSPALR